MTWLFRAECLACAWKSARYSDVSIAINYGELHAASGPNHGHPYDITSFKSEREGRS